MNENALKWVEALESATYAQKRGQLHHREDGKDSFCCLGVACRLAEEAGIVKSGPFTADAPDIGYFSPEGTAPTAGSFTFLPVAVRDWLGLTTRNGGFGTNTRVTHEFACANSLSLLNDDEEKTFAEIAAVIRSEPEGLFAS